MIPAAWRARSIRTCDVVCGDRGAEACHTDVRAGAGGADGESVGRTFIGQGVKIRMRRGQDSRAADTKDEAGW
jgi:hypothetical protein